ncbi:MAG TPA: CaiB/BaiF CoA-transferase family protein, partial [Candidatus Saccharimonadales bacterium]|nr:CaiB/BaiF CoA-transferase family protein [Candidatus Saccharimonadales bacterium]
TLNPDLVHLAISGYGPDGPAASRPGYDFVIQAVGGLMSITGDAADDGGHPTKVGVAISDVVTGLFAAIGVLSGLLASGSQRRGRRVRGQRIDVSLLGATLAVLVNQAQNAFVGGASPERHGNAHPNIVPYEAFAASDGELAVAVGSERQWPRFCEALGLPGLAADERFATNGDRVVHRAALRAVLSERFATRTVAGWTTILEAADIPTGPILDVAAAFATPEAQARRMTVDLEHPVLGRVRQAGLPIELAATPASIRSAPPLLGEHTDAVLEDLGFDADAIDALRRAGAI